MSDTVQAAIGARIRAIRIDHGWTQQDLAERADLSAPYVGQVERGLRDPGIGVLNRIAAALDIPLAALVTLTQTEAVAQEVTQLSTQGQRVVLALVRELQAYERRGSSAGS